MSTPSQCNVGQPLRIPRVLRSTEYAMKRCHVRGGVRLCTLVFSVAYRHAVFVLDRKERMRRSASSSRASSHAQNGQNGKKSAAPNSASNSSDPHADESSENHRDRDRDREDDERGRHVWGAGEEPIAPHLAKAITARWFAADLGNTTAAAAVYDEASPAVPRKRFRCLTICSSIGGIIAAVGGVQERTCAPYSTVLHISTRVAVRHAWCSWLNTASWCPAFTSHARTYLFSPRSRYMRRCARICCLRCLRQRSDCCSRPVRANSLPQRF